MLRPRCVGPIPVCWRDDQKVCVKHIQRKEAKKGNLYLARAFAFELSSESSFYSIETLIESRLKPYPLIYVYVI